MTRKKRMITTFGSDGRLLSNLGADATVFIGSGIIALLANLAVGSPFLVPAFMACGPVVATVLTKSEGHGALTAVLAAIVSVWAQGDHIRHPSLMFLLLLLAYIALVLFVGGHLRRLVDNLYEIWNITLWN